MIRLGLVATVTVDGDAGDVDEDAPPPPPACRATGLTIAWGGIPLPSISEDDVDDMS